MQALVEVYEHKVRRWALERAMFANAHFRGSGPAFIPEDFLGGADREQRQHDEAVSEMRAMQANSALMKIRKGEPPPEDVPDWAIGEYHHA